jgi:hypothetical protein
MVTMLIVRRIALSLLLIAVLVAPLWHLHIFDRNMALQKSDLVPVWLGVSATLHGDDPYSDQTTIHIQSIYYGRPLRLSEQSTHNHVAYAYPAYTAIVLAPLAHMGFATARHAFLLTMPLLLAASILLWLRILEVQLPKNRTALWTLLALTSFPVIWALRLQQPTILVAIFVAFGCWMLKTSNDTSAGLLMALSTIKPQLVLPLIAWMILWSLTHRRWRFVYSFGSVFTALLIAAHLLVPGWFSHWRSSATALLQYTHQRTTLHAMVGKWAAIVLTAALATITTRLLWKLRRCDSHSTNFGIAISLALSATIALQPTDLPMLYNQVFLIPGCFLLLHAKPSRRYADIARLLATGFVCWSFLSVVIAVIAEMIQHPSPLWDILPYSNTMLPLFVFLFLIFQPLTIEKRNTPQHLYQPNALSTAPEEFKAAKR